MMTQNTQKSQSAALPPSNIEAEESILGGILLDEHAMGRIVDLITPDTFYVQAHQKIYQAALDLHLQGEPTDFLTVTSKLNDDHLLEEVGGIEKLSQLLDRTVSAVNIDCYAKLIRKKRVIRSAIALGNDIVTNLQNYPPDNSEVALLEDLENQVHSLTQSHYRTGLSKEDHQCEQLLKKIKHIEISTDDPAQKYYKKLQLAKETKLGIRAIENLYCKSLIASNNSPPKTIAQLREEYGNSINEWLLHGFIPKGNVTLLHALGGVGKTRLVYEWAYHLVTGTSWNEQFNVTNHHRKILVVQTDEPPGDCLRTLEGRGFGDAHGLLIKTNWSFDHIASLRREIEENEIEFLIIDSMTSASVGSTFTENETEYALPILELRDLASDLGVSVVLIHHSNGEGKSRGTKAIHNSVSQVISLKMPSEGSQPDTTDRLLVIEKSRFRRPTTYKLAFCQDDQTGQWSWICEGENKDDSDPEKTGLAQQILQYVQVHRNIKLQAKEAVQLFNASLRSINSALLSLVHDGLLNRVRCSDKGRPWFYFLSWENLSSIPGKLFNQNSQTTASQTEPIQNHDSNFSGNWQSFSVNSYQLTVNSEEAAMIHEDQINITSENYLNNDDTSTPNQPISVNSCQLTVTSEEAAMIDTPNQLITDNCSLLTEKTASEPEIPILTASSLASVSSNVSGNSNIVTGAEEITITIDWGDLLLEIDQEMKRIGWSIKKGKEYLEQKYGVKSRQHLTDEQLFQFLNTLKSQPSKRQIKPGQTAMFQDIKIIVEYLVNQVVAVVREFDNPKSKAFEVAIAHLT